jgi:ABC-2 type transport system permease protein
MCEHAMIGALHAEWTKARTTGGPAWLLLGIVALTAGLSIAAVSAMTCPATGCAVDVPKLSLTGVQLGQAVVALLAVLVVSNEYGTGMIRTTLTAVPNRIAVLAAKTVVVAGSVLVTGAAGVATGVLAGRRIRPFALTGPALRAAGGSVLYLVLIGLLSVGVAALVRDSAAAVGTVLGVLYLSPILAGIMTNPAWQRHVEQIAPTTAGLMIQTTVGVHSLPLKPWAGLGVLALWAAGALVIGAGRLVLRDA